LTNYSKQTSTLAISQLFTILKTKMKKSNLLIVIILFCYSAQAKTTIRFATIAPEGSTWMVVMREMNEQLKEASGGELEFKFYPNMTMGDEKDVIRKMRFGQLQAAGFTGFGLGEILPEIRVLELPYLFSDDEEVDMVAESLYEYFSDALAKKGYVLLGWADVGWIYFLSILPVSEPKDLKTSKVWMWQGDPLADAFFKELEKSPVALPITDVLLSLQTGMIDAVYCSPMAALALQWFTRVEYISDVPFTHAMGAILMDKKAFEKLDGNEQGILLSVCKSSLKTLVEKSRLGNVEAYGQLSKVELSVVNSTNAQRQKLHMIGERVNNRLSGDLFSPSLLKQIDSLLLEYRTDKE